MTQEGMSILRGRKSVPGISSSERENRKRVLLRLHVSYMIKSLYELLVHNNSSNTITTVLPTEEPEYSLSIGDKHLSTILKMESDEVIKSRAKNLVPIPSEYEVTFDDESKCDVPVKDESSLIFTTFSNPIFDDNDDFTTSDDELLSNKDVSREDFKVYLNSLFDDEEINSNKIDPYYLNTESDLIESQCCKNRESLAGRSTTL
nr:hypothetical protein [Tanacetum cinerariifolium]